MEKATEKNKKIRTVKNYLIPLSIIGALSVIILISASAVLFTYGYVGYGCIVLMISLILTFITFLTARRAKDLSNILSPTEERISVWYLSKKTAVASAALELKKMSSDDIITSVIFAAFCLVLGGIAALLAKSLPLFLVMLSISAAIVIACLILHAVRRSRITSSNGICIFGEFGVYANGVYHSFCDIGIYKISSKYNDKNNLLLISYKNKLLSPQGRCYIPIFVPEGFEEEAMKINKFYAEYDED